jgi:GntR family transcriptional regulator
LTARRLAGRRGRDDGSARRLRDALRQNIVAGPYPDGLLPGEAEWMVAYGARRAAVREALPMSRRERLVERVQGIGTFAICEQRYASTFDEMHGRVDADAVSRRARPQILERSMIAAPDAVARKLGIVPGEPVVLLEYLGFVDGVAVWLASNYVKPPQGGALHEALFESEWYALRVGGPARRRLGVAPERGERRCRRGPPPGRPGRHRGDAGRGADLG